MKKLGYVLLFLVVLGIPLYWWMVVAAEDAKGRWPIDLAELRTLAKSIEGERPTEIRVEKVATYSLPKTAAISGDSWRGLTMATYAYQLVFPSRTVIVDTAMDEKTVRDELPTNGFDAAAWDRLQAALTVADFSLVTHEHFDHLGGLTKNPVAYQKAWLTPEQQAHPEHLKPLVYPAEKPRTLEYTGMKAMAPGVVVVRTPGHTQGSQIVYVQRADGAEFLFLGDVAWLRENVDRVRERPRLATLLMSEDRAAVLQQLQALHDVTVAAPGLHVAPGHDVGAVDALVANGALKPGFVVP